MTVKPISSYFEYFQHLSTPSISFFPNLVIVDCLHQPSQAITSFKSATNGAGAWVGGYLADRTGDYRAGFLLTASIQMICGVSYVPVAFMVP